MKKLLKQTIALTGWELHKIAARKTTPPPTRLESFLMEAKSLGFKPSLIFDIGANHGGWTSGVISIFPSAKFVLFEPQPHCGKDIEKVIQRSPSSIWRQAAVSNKSGTQKFKVSEWDVTSSLLFAEDSNSKFIEVEITTWTRKQVGKGEFRTF
jgi:hypothetical protein